MKRISGTFVILGGPPYEKEANQTSLQLLDELGRNNRVIYVCRSQQASLASAITRSRLGGRSAKGMAPGLHSLSSNSHVLVLPRITSWLPFVRPEVSRRINGWIVCRSIFKVLDHLEMQPFHLVSYWWMFPEIVASPRWTTSVFDVIDRHWGYEYLSPGAQKRNLQLAVRSARVAQRTVAVSEHIRAELQKVADTSVTVLSNGVSIDRVREILPSLRPSHRRKQAIYVGGWNGRVDVALLVSVVSKNPDWTFVFAGGERDATLVSYPNVRFVGPVSYSEAIRLMGESSVGLLPFVSNDYTNASNFLKVLDYLAAGCVVVATELSSLRAIADAFPANVERLDEDAWTAYFRDPVFPAALTDEQLGPWSSEARARALTGGMTLTEVDPLDLE